jgi:hypothetical protein
MASLTLNETEALEAELMEALRVARCEWQVADAERKPRAKGTWIRALKTFSAFIVDGVPPDCPVKSPAQTARSEPGR